MLWDALRRAHLVSQQPDKRNTLEGPQEQGVTAEEASAGRFTLDMVIEEEGANLSVGQRSLVSLARAIVIPSTITVRVTVCYRVSMSNIPFQLLDEATASVDYATDQLIQETISREFRDRTLLCIARESDCTICCFFLY